MDSAESARWREAVATRLGGLEEATTTLKQQNHHQLEKLDEIAEGLRQRDHAVRNEMNSHLLSAEARVMLKITENGKRLDALEEQRTVDEAVRKRDRWWLVLIATPLAGLVGTVLSALGVSESITKSIAAMFKVGP